MFILIFSLAFLIVAGLCMMVGALKGKKLAWQLSVTRIALSAVSAVISALLAMLVAWLVSGVLFDVVLGMTGLSLDSLIADLPVTEGVAVALMAMIIAPMFYLLFYSIVRPLMKLLTKLLTTKFIELTNKGKKKVVVETIVDQEEEIEEVPEVTDLEEKYAEEFAQEISQQEATEEDVMAKYMNEFQPEEKPKTDKKAKKAKVVFAIENSNWVSALCGALCSLVTLCILMVPTVGFLDVVDDVMVIATVSSSEESGDSAMTVLADVVDGAANNAGSVTVKLMGGGLVYDMMTTYTVDGVSGTLRDETGFMSSAAKAGILITNDNVKKEEQADAIRDVSDEFDDADLVPMLVSDVSAAASDDWKQGRDFHGMEMPFKDSVMHNLMMSTVEAFSLSGRDTIKYDMGTLIEALAVLADHDALKDMEEDPMIILSNEEATASVLLNLLNNPRLCIMVDGISDFGIEVMLSAVKANKERGPLYDEFIKDIKKANAVSKDELAAKYAEIFDQYGLVVSQEKCEEAAMKKLSGNNILDWVSANVVKNKDEFIKKTELVTVDMITEGRLPVTKKKEESKKLARAYAQSYELMNKMSKSSYGIDEMVVDMGPVLDTFATTESVGEEKTAYMLKAMFQTETVGDEIGFTVLESSDSADSISKNAKTKTYKRMLNSMMLAVDMVDAASKPGVNTKAAVDKMLEDLTPESAEVLKTTATPSVMKNYGVPDKSADPTSELMGDIFENLSKAREAGMSDADYAKESFAVSNVMGVLMNSGSGPIFGERSATGTSADDFVANVMNSTVMANTLIDKVYVDGSEEPVHDPLLSNRKMSQEETDSFVNALNNEWIDSDRSELSRQKIISLASIMNVKIEISVEFGVQYVAPATTEAAK